MHKSKQQRTAEVCTVAVGLFKHVNIASAAPDCMIISLQSPESIYMIRIYELQYIGIYVPSLIKLLNAVRMASCVFTSAVALKIDTNEGIAFRDLI